MLVTILLTVAFFGVAVAAMAVGVAVSGRRLAGSCGGVGGEACSCSREERAQCRKEADADEAPPRKPATFETTALPSIDQSVRPGEGRLVRLKRGEVELH